MMDWTELEACTGSCTRCGLCETRHNVVFGVGSREADVMFVGEGPGEKDQQITELRLWYKGRCVGQTVLYAQNGVASVDDPGFTVQNGAARSDDDMSKLLTYAVLFLVIFLGLSGLYLGINAARRAAAKKRARRKRRQQRDARMQHRRR